jgi:hypothetical protein
MHGPGVRIWFKLIRGKRPLIVNAPSKQPFDPQRKAIFERLRDLWIALGNKRFLVTEAQWATDIEALNCLHLEWTLAEALKETAPH